MRKMRVNEGINLDYLLAQRSAFHPALLTTPLIKPLTKGQFSIDLCTERSLKRDVK